MKKGTLVRWGANKERLVVLANEVPLLFDASLTASPSFFFSCRVHLRGRIAISVDCLSHFVVLASTRFIERPSYLIWS